MKWTAVLVLIIGLCGCGADDVVEGPYVDGWDLTASQLTITVFDHPGAAEASCVIYPLGNNGLEIPLDGVEDLLPDTVYHEVFVTGPFTITGGDAIAFEVDLPEVDDPDFWRWQVVCDPGAPG